jgi:hypothetical protein
MKGEVPCRGRTNGAGRAERWEVSISEKKVERCVESGKLARRMGILPQNFNRQMKRDNFAEKDLQRIAEVLNCDFEAGFVLKDTGERI